MAKSDLLKEAIADAKAVKETALANAKVALEEAFTPRLQSMLSAQLSEEEITKIVGDIIAQTGAQGMKDMGKVMGMASKQMAGTADGKTISTIVKQLLS